MIPTGSVFFGARSSNYFKGEEMKKYYLGLDGGASKTHIALYEAEGAVVDLYAGRQSNYENMEGGYEELAVVLNEMTGELLGRNNIAPRDITSAAFGMAGVDTKKQYAVIHKILKNLGFNDFILSNDAYLGVKAGSSTGYGVSCVNGSGYSVAGIDDNGGMLQIGGIGSLTGDKGGSFWLVPESISYAYGELYKKYKPSLITKYIMEELKINTKDDYTEALHRRLYEDRRGLWLAVSKSLFEAAYVGDETAIGLLERSGRSYGESVFGILTDLNFIETPEIILTGSLYQKHPDSPIVNGLKKFLDAEYKKPYVTRVLDAPAVLGALVWAMGDDGKKIRGDLKNKLAEASVV